MKGLFKEVAIILMVVIPLALISNSLRSDGLGLFDTSMPVGPPVETNGHVREIAMDKAIEKHRSVRALFVDTRSPEDYLAGHIRGALNLPDHHFDEWVGDFLSKTDPDTEVIAYCDGEDCPLGRNVAEKLCQLGFTRASYLTNGLSKWRENSLPIATGGNQDNHEK